MKKLLAIAACACGAAAAQTKAPMEWTPVQTNEISRWKAECRAPKGVVADKASRTVRFLVEATGVSKGETVEFFAIGPLSDRAYESLFVAAASPGDIAAAFDEIGVPRGRGVDPMMARLWPQGEKVRLSVAPWGAGEAKPAPLTEFLRDVRAADGDRPLDAPLAYTGGARDAAGQPIAATNEPCAVLALYSHGPALMQLDGMFDQSGAYGRFVAAEQRRAGDLFEVRATWDGVRRVKERELLITATNAAEVMAGLREDAAKFDVHARLAFDASVTVERAAAVARAFAMLDGAGIKMNGRCDGGFFYRAFLPEEKWREREGRIFQPFEVRLAADGSREFTFVEEDWSGDGLDPALKPRTAKFSRWDELPGLVNGTGDQGRKINVMFLYAPKSTRVADLEGAVRALSPRIGTFYVFGD